MRLIEPIDRYALLAAYDAKHKGPPGRARKLIEKAPTVEPKRGRWIPLFEDDETNWMKCSECGNAFFGETNYCPNCGARMEGDETDD